MNKDDLFLLFKEVAEEFYKEVERINNLWNNDEILCVLLQKNVSITDNPFYPAFRKLFKQEDKDVVAIIYGVFETYDCVESLRGANNPFVYNVGKVYWDCRMRIEERKNIEKEEDNGGCEESKEGM